MSRSTEVTLERMLDVVADFADFHESSVELVAWELNISPLPVGRLWSIALDQGLLAPAGSDVETGESLYALTDAGWAALGRTPPPARSTSLTGA